MMKCICICLIALTLVGCGYGSRTYNPGMPGTGSAAPAVASISPNSATAGSPALVMTVNGSNFGRDAVVYWNAQPMSTMFVSANQVAASVPATSLTTAAMIPIYVRTRGVNSNTMNFTVQ